MHTGTRVTKKKGLLLPEPFVNKIITAFPTCIGMAFIEDGEVIVQGQPSPFSLATLSDFQKQFQDKDILFFFGKSDGEMTDEDVQPFPLILTGDAKDRKCLLAGTLDGDYSLYHKPEHTAPAEAFAMLDIKERLDMLWAAADEDIGVFWKMLGKNAKFTEFFNDITRERGELTLLASNGEFKTFSKGNTLGGTFEWGSVSNILDYQEGEFPAKEKPVSTGFAAGKKVVKKKPAATVEPSKEEATPARSTVLHAPAAAAKAATSVPATGNGNGQVLEAKKVPFQRCPKGLSSEKTKNWLNHYVGRCPQGWRDMVKNGQWMQVKRIDATQPVEYREVQYKDFRELAHAVGHQPMPDAPDKAGAAEAAKDITEKTFEKNVAPIHKPAAEKTHAVPPKQLEAFEKNFMTSVDMKALREEIAKNGTPVLTPEFIQDLEFKGQTYSDLTKRDLREFLYMKEEKRKVLRQGYGELFDLAVAGLISMLHKYMPEESKKMLPAQVPEVVASAPADGTKKKVVKKKAA
jgi:hypothetical protein